MITRPNCENRRPYCNRAGQPMKCVEENSEHFVFACGGCGQVNIITRPEHRQKLKERAAAQQYQQRPTAFQPKYF